MATYRRHNTYNRPWHARRKREGLEYSLGYYPTEAEAVEAEHKFDREWPPARYGRKAAHA